MKKVIECSALSVSLLVVLTVNFAKANEALCDLHVHTMLSAQSIRAGEEVEKCLFRSAEPDCSFSVSELDAEGRLHLIGANERLTSGFQRVEWHAENKFPRKCSGEFVPEFFSPICSKAIDIEGNLNSNFNSKEDLAECLYLEHVLPWMFEFYQVLNSSSLEPSCLKTIAKNLRFAYREEIRKDNIDYYPTKKSRAMKACDFNAEALTLWNELEILTQAAAAPLRALRR